MNIQSWILLMLYQHFLLTILHSFNRYALLQSNVSASEILLAMEFLNYLYSKHCYISLD